VYVLSLPNSVCYVIGRSTARLNTDCPVPPWATEQSYADTSFCEQAEELDFPLVNSGRSMLLFQIHLTTATSIKIHSKFPSQASQKKKTQVHHQFEYYSREISVFGKKN
jgi:hypothetical protein